jgi:hypothetical protein
LASLTPVYSANRSVREYLDRAYLPAANSYYRRAQNAGELGIEISAWRRALEQAWGTLKFGSDRYTASVPAVRAAGDYAARIVAAYPDVNTVLEAPHILWRR